MQSYYLLAVDLWEVCWHSANADLDIVTGFGASESYIFFQVHAGGGDGRLHRPVLGGQVPGHVVFELLPVFM